jgi:hypothetical protein
MRIMEKRSWSTGSYIWLLHKRNEYGMEEQVSSYKHVHGDFYWQPQYLFKQPNKCIMNVGVNIIGVWKEFGVAKIMKFETNLNKRKT